MKNEKVNLTSLTGRVSNRVLPDHAVQTVFFYRSVKRFN